MRRVIATLCVTCVFLLLAAPLLAQEKAPGAPPTILQVFREELKPGKAAAHTQHEAGWPKAFAQANWKTHYLAMASVTGPSEAWYMTAFDSLEAWEKDTAATEGNAALSAQLASLAAADGEMLSNHRSVAMRYRPDLSYGPPVTIPNMRYFFVTSTRVKPGYGRDYTEAMKYVIEAHKKVDMKESWAMYEVIAGGPAGTFVMLIPIKSLKQVDENVDTHGKEYQEALADISRGKYQGLIGNAVQSSETNYFRFNPQMSYLSDSFKAASEDPAFWSPKTEVAAATAKKGKTKVMAKE